MAFEHRIELSRRLGVLTFRDKVTGDELPRAMEALYHDADWQAGFDTIWDFSAMESLVLEQDDLKALVALDGVFEKLAGPGRDVAVVVREMDYILGRLHMALAKEGPRQNFLCRTKEEAYALLAGDGAA